MAILIPADSQYNPASFNLKPNRGGNKKRRRRPGSIQQFPGRLHDMMTYVEQRKLEHIVTWVSNGTALMVLDSKALVEQVLPLFFGASKYRSFTRQMCGWRFTRVIDGPFRGAFVHQYFLRGQKQLCSRMSRAEPVQKSAVPIIANPQRQNIAMQQPASMEPIRIFNNNNNNLPTATVAMMSATRRSRSNYVNMVSDYSDLDDSCSSSLDDFQANQPSYLTDNSAARNNSNRISGNSSSNLNCIFDGLDLSPLASVFGTPSQQVTNNGNGNNQSAPYYGNDDSAAIFGGRRFFMTNDDEQNQKPQGANNMFSAKQFEPSCL